MNLFCLQLLITNNLWLDIKDETWSWKSNVRCPKINYLISISTNQKKCYFLNVDLVLENQTKIELSISPSIFGRIACGKVQTLVFKWNGKSIQMMSDKMMILLKGNACTEKFGSYEFENQICEYGLLAFSSDFHFEKTVFSFWNVKIL